MCSESIDLFPDPDPNASASSNNSNIEILELLWFEVERQQPKELERILPIIEKICKERISTLQNY